MKTVSQTDLQAITRMVDSFPNDSIELLTIRLKAMFDVVQPGHYIALGYAVGLYEKDQEFSDLFFKASPN